MCYRKVDKPDGAFIEPGIRWARSRKHDFPGGRNMRGLDKAVAVFMLGLLTSASTWAVPNVPGFTVTEYANWYDPVAGPFGLAFAPSGDLYVGMDVPGSGEPPLKILRIDVGGTPVEGLPVENYEYGDTPVYDPDTVIFDATGRFSGTPGSVLVGCGFPGRIWAIHPDETVHPLCEGWPIMNPHKMALDNTGRLLISDETAQKIYVSDAGCPTTVFAAGHYFSGITVDSDNHVFTRTGDTIRIYASDGTLLDDAFATGLQNPSVTCLAFGPAAVWGTDVYTISAGELRGYDAVFDSPSYGQYTVLGTGFDSARDMAFGPDGALYVSVEEDTIFRIIPEPPVNQPPVITCNGPVVLWSPDHELVDVSAAFSVTDPDDDPVTLSFRVFSDEPETPETGDGTGRHAPDFKDEHDGGRGLLVRSERRGSEDGRYYIFVITADDGNGGVTTGVCVAAVVPHDQDQQSLDDVIAQAEAAVPVVQDALDNGGELPPPGLYEHGLADPLGPKQ